jgi:hypothetical protein
VFRFCAIPQVMAIATLDKCFNNHDVFTGVVKVRKGLAVSMIADSTTLEGVEAWFHRFAASIKAKVDPADPSAAATRKACDVCLELTADKRPVLLRLPSFLPPLATFALAFSAYGRKPGSAPLGAQLLGLLKGSTRLRKDAASLDLVTTFTCATFLVGYAASAFSYRPALGANGKLKGN